MLLFDSLDNTGPVSTTPEGITFLSHPTHDAHEMLAQHEAGQCHIMDTGAEEGGEGIWTLHFLCRM